MPFDDFLFTPQYSVVERRDPSAIDLTSRFSRRLSLKRPIVSANMDTVTRAEMAIAVAEEGGLGVIDRGFRSGEIEPQVREVQIVKRKQHGVTATLHDRPDAILPKRLPGCATRASARCVVDAIGGARAAHTSILRFVDQGRTFSSG